MLLLSQPALKLVYTATKITIILITTFSGTKVQFPKSSQFERGGVQGSSLQERSHLQSPRSNAARCLHRLKVKVKVRAAWRPRSAFPSHMSRARGPCQVAPQPVFVQEQAVFALAARATRARRRKRLIHFARVEPHPDLSSPKVPLGPASQSSQDTEKIEDDASCCVHELCDTGTRKSTPPRTGVKPSAFSLWSVSNLHSKVAPR